MSDPMQPPACAECGAPLDVAYWQGVTLGRAEAYRPVCAACAGSWASSAPEAPCSVCWRPTALGPAPERRGLWRSRTTVCSLACLDHATHGPPPEPRRCAWCREPFTPRRRSDARLCSERCRQAKRRATVRWLADPLAYAEHLTDLGSPAAVFGAALDALDEIHPAAPTATTQERTRP